MTPENFQDYVDNPDAVKALTARLDAAICGYIPDALRAHAVAVSGSPEELLQANDGCVHALQRARTSLSSPVHSVSQPATVDGTAQQPEVPVAVAVVIPPPPLPTRTQYLAPVPVSGAPPSGVVGADHALQLSLLQWQRYVSLIILACNQ